MAVIGGNEGAGGLEARTWEVLEPVFRKESGVGGHYDLVVVGGGIVGVCIAYFAARRGKQVMVVDPMLPQRNGPSSGDTRLFRMAYFEAPEYVPILRASRDFWYEVGEFWREEVFKEKGVLMVGKGDSDLVAGAKVSALLHGVPVEILEEEVLRERYPQFCYDDGEVGVFDPEGGYIYAEKAYLAVATMAEVEGALFFRGNAVRSFSENSKGVVFNEGEFVGDRAVLCCGSATGALIGRREAITPVWQVLTYWRFPGWLDSMPWPGFAFMEGDTLAYGIGITRDSSGVKVARHIQTVTTPDDLERERGAVRAVVKRRFGCRSPEFVDSTQCAYDMSPDGDFLLGKLPGSSRVAVAAGMSGHGFKSAPGVAQAVLNDLYGGGKLEIPERLRVDRLF